MARPFADVLRELAAGNTYDELTTQLGELVEAVKRTGKAGDLTIKLHIKPNGDGSVIVTDDVKIKMPELPRGSTIFFTSTDGALTRQDPRQAELPLRRVESATLVPGMN